MADSKRPKMIYYGADFEKFESTETIEYSVGFDGDSPYEKFDPFKYMKKMHSLKLIVKFLKKRLTKMSWQAYNNVNRTQHASQRCGPRWVF